MEASTFVPESDNKEETAHSPVASVPRRLHALPDLSLMTNRSRLTARQSNEGAKCRGRKDHEQDFGSAKEGQVTSNLRIAGVRGDCSSFLYSLCYMQKEQVGHCLNDIESRPLARCKYEES